jgi:serine/threonine protein kinase
MTVGPEELVGDRYRVDGLVARGGMANVYRARDVVLDRPVALKVVRGGATDVRRFETEARLLGRLEHPNLVRLLDGGQWDGVPYLVFELVEGPTLEMRLERGPLGIAEARGVGCDIAHALAYVHGRGVLHRDVKPSNILLAPDGRALLSDFGVARLADGTRNTAAGTTVGTAAYLAPEQVGGAEVTPAADIYALGLVLIEALSGRPAFAGTAPEMLAVRLTTDPQIPAGLAPPWPGLVRAMTRRHPADRPDAAMVAAQLGALSTPVPAADTAEIDITQIHPVPAAHLTRRPLDAGAPAPSPGSMERSPVLFWLLAAVVILAGLATFLVAFGGLEIGAPPDEAADGTTSSTSTTTVPRTTTTVATTSTTAPTTTQPAEVSLAATCAALDARKDEIDTERHSVDETYREDPDTRERLKDQLEDEKQAIDDQRHALSC